MAPVDRIDHDGIEQQLKDVIQDFYRVMVQVSTYDSMGVSSKEVLSKEMNNSKSLSTSLQNVHVAASPPHLLPSVPPELLEYVENGRNPDIYTREFVELVRRGNQLMRGKQSAFASFRDVLAEQMSSAMPELREDVAKVLEATGGNPTIAAGGAAAGSSGTTSSNLPARPASAVQGGQTGSQ
ncbi:hypothetical protein MKX08_009850 [Trichoderma sp. CBMAI-0020]|nr:hypothetical protein MKX08_009850 [Trichoderma sp. CBMAI-0020]